MADNPQQPPDTPTDTPLPWRAPGAGGRRGLGRGLGALIPGADLDAEPGVMDVPVDRIRPNPRQPRVQMDEAALAALEASVREHGVLQPVLVRPSREQAGAYELVAGERRWRAAVAAGLRTVPAVVRPLDDRSALEAAIVENLQREDLNPVERASAYRQLLEEFGMTQEQLAKRIGRSQPSVANTLRLLSLPAEILASLQAGRITEGHARALLAIEGTGTMIEAWRQVETRGLSVRETEILARRAGISRGIRSKAHRRGTTAKEINIIEQSLETILLSPVRIIPRASGGEIRIRFSSPEDLDRLVHRLTGGRPG